jgi:hypothetical protein
MIEKQPTEYNQDVYPRPLPFNPEFLERVRRSTSVPTTSSSSFSSHPAFNPEFCREDERSSSCSMSVASDPSPPPCNRSFERNDSSISIAASAPTPSSFVEDHYNSSFDNMTSTSTSTISMDQNNNQSSSSSSSPYHVPRFHPERVERVFMNEEEPISQEQQPASTASTSASNHHQEDPQPEPEPRPGTKANPSNNSAPRYIRVVPGGAHYSDNINNNSKIRKLLWTTKGFAMTACKKVRRQQEKQLEQVKVKTKISLERSASFVKQTSGRIKDSAVAIKNSAVVFNEKHQVVDKTRNVARVVALQVKRASISTANSVRSLEERHHLLSKSQHGIRQGARSFGSFVRTSASTRRRSSF